MSRILLEVNDRLKVKMTLSVVHEGKCTTTTVECDAIVTEVGLAQPAIALVNHGEVTVQQTTHGTTYDTVTRDVRRI